MKTENNKRIKILATLMAVCIALTAIMAASGCRVKNIRSSTGKLNSLTSLKWKDGKEDWQGWRPEVSQGAKNTVLNALYMYNTFWTPKSTISAWGTSKVTNRRFVEGHTYRGIPYGQPVHKGWYVGTTRTVEDFLAALSDPDNEIYTERGENTWYYTDHGGPIWYSPYYSNDCSGFVSAALGIKRHTTSAIAADTELFPVIGTDLKLARPGDLLNSAESGHVIMIYDVEFERNGREVRNVVTIEQTPTIIVVRSFGKEGVNGSLDDLRNKISNGKYYIVRYKDIDDVKLIDGAEAGLPQVVNAVAEPSSLLSVNGAVKGNAYIDPDAESFLLEGWSLNKEIIDNFEYRINGGEAVELIRRAYPELNRPVFGFSNLEYKGGVNYYLGMIPLTGVSEGDVIEVWATCGGEKYLSASLTVCRKPDYYQTSSWIESVTMYQDSDNVYRLSVPWSPMRSDTFTLNGWLVTEDLAGFEIRVDNGLWYPVANSFRDDVYNATAGYFPDCRDVNAFYCGVDLSGWGQYETHVIELRAVKTNGDNFIVAVCEYGAKTGLAVAYVIIACAAAALLIIAFVVFMIIKKKRKKIRASQTPQACPTDRNSA